VPKRLRNASMSSTPIMPSELKSAEPELPKVLAGEPNKLNKESMSSTPILPLPLRSPAQVFEGPEGERLIK